MDRATSLPDWLQQCVSSRHIHAFVTNHACSPIKLPVIYDCRTITILFFIECSDIEYWCRNKRTSDHVCVYLELNEV